MDTQGQVDPASQSQSQTSAQQPVVTAVNTDKQVVATDQNQQTIQPVEQTEVDKVDINGKQVVSGAKPEHGPISSNQEHISISESQPELKLHPEVEKAGVEVVPPEIKVPEQVTRVAGLEPAKEAVPVNTSPTGKTQLPPLPFKEEETNYVIKTTKVNDSKHWLAVLTRFVIDSIRKGFRGKLN